MEDYIYLCSYWRWSCWLQCRYSLIVLAKLYPSLPTKLNSSDVMLNNQDLHYTGQYISWIEKAEQFTVEDTRERGAIPVLDTFIMPTPNGTLSTGVYSKPTHTDLYLKWDKHHTSAKCSVIGTHKGPKQFVELQNYYEKKCNTCRCRWKHLHNPNIHNGSLNRIQSRTQLKQTAHNTSNSTNSSYKYRGHIVIPYNMNISECIKNIWKMVYKHIPEMAEHWRIH